MKSLFDPTDNHELIERINSLSAQSGSLWGKMNVSQMLAHAQHPLQVAFGELKLKRGLMGMLFGTMVKKQMMTAPQFKRNLPTDKHFLVTTAKNFEEEKNKLINLVRRFAELGPEGISKDPHPFFGRMTTTEWDVIQYKHLDHHLRQFGV